MADSVTERSESKEKVKRDRRQSSDVSGEGAWISAHHDPVASLYTFTSCIDLKDLDGDGDHKLLIGDLASGQHDIKLKIFKGTQLSHEIPLLDLPSGVIAFMMDTNEPAIAVASGTFVYIYKTIRPYFKFTLPLLEINSQENQLWEQAKEDEIDPTQLRDGLEALSSSCSDPPLTERSLAFLQLDAEDLLPFTSIFKPIPLKRQTIVTCMSTLYKSYNDESAASCIVVGTENKDIYIIDPAAFTFLSRMQLPAIPVFLSIFGIYDVDFSISAACRDGVIYTVMKDQPQDVSSLPRIPLSSQAVGLLRDEKTLTVATMNHMLSCYSAKGKLLWSVNMPDSITTIGRMEYGMKNFKAVIVALANGEIRIYKDKFLVNQFKMDDVIVGLKFGQFGREEGSLVLISQSGAIYVKILKRSVSFEVKESRPGPIQSQLPKLNVPKKTKVFVDQTIRERESATFMHQTFQQHLLQLKVDSAKSYAKALSSSLAPLTSSKETSLTVSAQVQGIGPLFKVSVILQNTSPILPLTDHYLVFQSDESLYTITKKYIQLPLLVPGVSYSFSTMVECLSDFGQTDSIKVCVHRHGNPFTLLTAIIDMPASENIVL